MEILVTFTLYDIWKGHTEINFSNYFDKVALPNYKTVFFPHAFRYFFRSYETLSQLIFQLPKVRLNKTEQN